MAPNENPDSVRLGSIAVAGRRIETGWWGNAPGATPVLVLLHEGLGSVGLWRDFPAELAHAAGLPVFAYSRFGYGRSDTIALPRPPRYMNDEADLVPAVLDAAAIGACVLIGHSDGASIAAIQAGGVADARVRGLVLIAPHFFVEDGGLAHIAEIRADYEGGLRSRLARHHDDVDAAFRGWNDAWLDPAFRTWDITAHLPRITVPMLVVQGEDDPYGTTAQPRASEQHSGGPVETLLMPGIGHAPHLEAPTFVRDAIVRFIRSRII